MNDTKPALILAFANDRAGGGGYLRRLDDERRAVLDALAPAVAHDWCEVHDLPDATHAQVLDALLGARLGDRTAIFHFAGHADDATLMLEGAGGSSQAAHAGGLARILGHQQRLQLAFLNGCGTETHAVQLFAAGVPAVIVTSEAIDDGVAAEFAVRFYQGIGAGRTIRRAYDDARAALETRFGDDREAVYQHRSFVPASGPMKDWPWHLYPDRGGLWHLGPPAEATAGGGLAEAEDAGASASDRSTASEGRQGIDLFKFLVNRALVLFGLDRFSRSLVQAAPMTDPTEPTSDGVEPHVGSGGGTGAAGIAGATGAGVTGTTTIVVGGIVASVLTAGAVAIWIRTNEGPRLEESIPMQALLYRRACEQQEPEGCYSYGELLRHGSSEVGQNLAEAFVYYSRSCELGGHEGCLAAARILDTTGDPGAGEQARSLRARACAIHPPSCEPGSPPNP